METIRHSIDIGCSPQALYEYIAQPWRWHEWHPNSKSAEAQNKALGKHDRFEEVYEIRVLPFLPLKLRRLLQWRVVAEMPYSYWEIEATTKDGLINIAYNYDPRDTAVRFTRTVKFELSGITAVLTPLLKKRNTVMSEVALANMKRIMESTACPQPELPGRDRKP